MRRRLRARQPAASCRAGDCADLQGIDKQLSRRCRASSAPHLACSRLYSPAPRLFNERSFPTASLFRCRVTTAGLRPPLTCTRPVVGRTDRALPAKAVLLIALSMVAAMTASERHTRRIGVAGCVCAVAAAAADDHGLIACRPRSRAFRVFRRIWPAEEPAADGISAAEVSDTVLTQAKT